MTTVALFVDLPNLYTQLIKADLGEPRSLRDYFLNWFDFDRLAQRLTNQYANTWIFYSGGRIGPSEARIDGNFLNEFISRVNSLRGVTARDVNIPGTQRETLNIVCSNCGSKTATEWNSEKGIDASLIVYLFDTMESWDTAYLLSGDADYVPAVASLRRRGKIVTGAGFPSASSALIRECYEYIDLREVFFGEDFATYLICKPDGLIPQWMQRVRPESASPLSDKLEVSFGWHYTGLPDAFSLSVTATGNHDASDWMEQVRKLPKCPIRIDSTRSTEHTIISFKINFVHWRRAEEALRELVAKIPDIEQEGDKYSPAKLDSYKLEYRLNRQTLVYEREGKSRN